jgi:hypothetical protein
VTSLQGSTAFAIGFGFVNAVFVVLGASVLAWLYRRHASELLQHVAP